MEIIIANKTMPNQIRIYYYNNVSRYLFYLNVVKYFFRKNNEKKNVVTKVI